MQATLGELGLLGARPGGGTGGSGAARGGPPARRPARRDYHGRFRGPHRSLADSRASAVVCPRSFVPNGTPALLVDDAHKAFSKIVIHFRPLRAARRIGVSRLAAVSPTAALGVNVDVHPYATIGDDVKISNSSTIHSGTTSWPEWKSART